MGSRFCRRLRLLVGIVLASALFAEAALLVAQGVLDRGATKTPNHHATGCRRCVPQGYRYA